MDLDSYCRRHGTDTASVLTALRQAMDDQACGCICLAGSVIEGIGNARSDLDAYVIGATAPACTFGAVQIVRIGSITVDIEYVEAATLHRLVGRMAPYPAHILRDARQSALALTQGELKLLHNICIAIPVQHSAFLQEIQARIDPHVLSRCLFDYSAVLIDAVQQDVIGFIEANDHASAVASLRIQRQHLAGAMLAALGATNPAEKWRPLHMRRAAARYAGLMLPGGRTFGDMVDCWFALDTSIAGASPVTSLAQCSLLANTVLPWGLQRFADGLPALAVTSHARTPAVAPPGDSDICLPVLPPLAYDCVLRRDADGVWLSRMGTAQRLYLNALGLETVLQFSGRRTMQAALQRLSQVADASPQQLERSIEDFHQVLSAQKLVMAPGLLPC